MIKTLRRIQPIYMFVDALCIFSACVISYALKYYFQGGFLQGTDLPYVQAYCLIFALWGGSVFLIFKHLNLYRTDRNLSIPRESVRVFSGVACSAFLAAAAIFFLQYKFFSREVFSLTAILLCVFLSSWRTAKRLILRRLIERGFHAIHIAIIGTGTAGHAVLREMQSMRSWGFRVAGFLDDGTHTTFEGLPILGRPCDLASIVRTNFIDEVIIAHPYSDQELAVIMNAARTMNIGVRVVPQGFVDQSLGMDLGYVGTLPLVTYKERIHPATDYILKRWFDVIVASLALVVSLPVWAVLAILIKLDSPGPVLYMQKRVGAKGMTFTLFKFRSMVHDADSLKNTLLDKNEVPGGVMFKIKNDPRVTRMGGFLRRFSLDELPQLINVLKGDMSLVGPRPPTPDEVRKYHDNHMQRLSMRPGLTGMSQTRGRSELTFQQWVKWDVWYVNNWSFGLDMMILLRSIPVVLKGEGAY